MSAVYRWLFPMAAAMVLAAPVSAQWKPIAASGPHANELRTIAAPSALTAGHELGLASPADEASPETSTPAYVAPPLPGIERSGQDVAMMVVGGAALVVGSIIGGDAGTLMMVGGGVIGLVGLYRYVR